VPPEETELLPLAPPADKGEASEQAIAIRANEAKMMNWDRLDDRVCMALSPWPVKVSTITNSRRQCGSS
jgi:hypothetical protein